MTDDANKEEIKQANQRGAARLAAVQALYQMDIAGTGVNEIAAEFERHWLGQEVEGETYLPAELVGKKYYRPTQNGEEARIAERQRKLKRG